ncbi:MAG: glycine--tRNA ligase subunit beta [Deltaproteobacteria bacterium]|nr:glycine--tRNA ligase subunit beta [Deltaproteobacteria bacterium]
MSGRSASPPGNRSRSARPSGPARRPRSRRRRRPPDERCGEQRAARPAGRARRRGDPCRRRAEDAGCPGRRAGRDAGRGRLGPRRGPPTRHAASADGAHRRRRRRAARPRARDPRPAGARRFRRRRFADPRRRRLLQGPGCRRRRSVPARDGEGRIRRAAPLREGPPGGRSSSARRCRRSSAACRAPSACVGAGSATPSSARCSGSWPSPATRSSIVASPTCRAGRDSRGHRFYGNAAGRGPEALEGEVVTLLRADLELYRHLLRAAHVMVEPTERRAAILEGAREQARAAGGTLVQDDETLEVCTWLVEWPQSLLGRIAPSLLRIPDAVTQTTLRENQKLFTIRGADGKLLPSFIATTNTLHPGSEAIIAAGNARVVSARMADAAFFYDADRSRPLSDFVPKLGSHLPRGMGSTLDKVARIEALTAHLADALAPAAKADALRAASLCKADLVTQMVFEFPELQGVIGEDYALTSGETAAVAAAVREHYLPRGAADDLPAGDAGALVGLADRLDSIAATFGLGLVPSGSNDPYALRRAALGVLRVLQGRGWTVDLGLILAQAVAGLPTGAAQQAEDALAESLLDFFRGRLRSWLTDADASFGGHAADTAEAVLEAGFGDVPAVFERAAALSAFRQDEAFAALAAGFKRVGNLAKKASEEDLAAPVDQALFEKDAERGLFQAVEQLEDAVAADVRARDWAGALGKLAGLRAAVDAFFDDVMVMADDPTLRRNRLALLGRTGALFAQIADFARIQQA